VQHNDQSNDEYWEEIFDSVDMDFLPIEYLDLIVVKFLDGKVWEIDIGKSSKTVDNVEETLEQFFEEYEDNIDTIDFRLNLKKIQNDIGKRTKRFLKLNK
jgi:acid phosphatase class B